MLRDMRDIEQLENIPLEQRDLPKNTYALVKRGAEHPSGDALIFFLQGTQYTHAEHYSYPRFLAEITQAANLFHTLGIGKNDAVSVLLPNLPETWISLLGAEAAGIANPINPLLEPHIIAEIMNAAETKVLVTLSPFPGTDLWAKAEQLRGLVPTLHTILTVDMGHYLSTMQKLGVGIANLRAAHPKSDDKVNVLDFNHERARQVSDHLVSGREIQPDDVASYFHTGGTTGIPKLAKHTHFNEVFNAWAMTLIVPPSPNRSIIGALPLFHVNGFIVTGLHPFLMGNTVILATPQGYRGKGVIANFWKIVEHYQVDFVTAVPTVYTALLQRPVDADVSSLKFALCGAMPTPVNTFRAFEANFKVKMLEGYGLTEGTCVCATNPPDGERRVGSIGLRMPYQQMKVVKLDSEGKYERECAPDEIGVVVMRGPNVFPGYKQEQHNRDIWVEIGGERWLNSGDMGKRDADGYFWLTGRKKELIIRGGHNIDPALIEDPLMAHPAVMLAAAVGRPEARLGEVPAVYVQLKDGQSVTETELMDFLKGRIGEQAALPKKVTILKEMPLTVIGKIYKPELRGREIAEVYQDGVRALDGVMGVSAQIEQDSSTGQWIKLAVKLATGVNRAAIEAQINAALGHYTTPFELVWG